MLILQIAHFSFYLYVSECIGVYALQMPAYYFSNIPPVLEQGIAMVDTGHVFIRISIKSLEIAHDHTFDILKWSQQEQRPDLLTPALRV